MPREIQIKSIRNQLPVRYRYNPWVRGLMLGFAVIVLVYTLFFLVKVVNGNMPMFFKLLPLVILFISLDSILRQITSLNCVLFSNDTVSFSFLAKRKLEVPYESITKLELNKRITYFLRVVYIDASGLERTFQTPASFPKILEIILTLANLSPNVKLNGVLSKAVEHLRSQAEANETEQV
jgi:hypothetical protein